MSPRERLSVAALATMVGNLLTRFTGLAREIVFARVLGTSAMASDFLSAFTYANLARRMFGEGAVANVLVPELSGREVQEDGDAQDFASRILTALWLWLNVLSLVACVVFVILGQVLPQPFPERVVRLSCLMMPYMPVVCLSGVLGAILNLRGSFAWPAFSYAFTNLAIIIGCLLLGRLPVSLCEDVDLLAVLVVGSALVQFAVLAWMLHRRRWQLSLMTDLWRYRQQIWAFVVVLTPILIGSCFQQISTALDKVIARMISDDAVAALNYAERMIYFPVGIFGVALGSACLPAIARAISREDHVEAQETFRFGLAQAAFLCLPCMSFFVVAGRPFLELVYGGGSFDAESLDVTLPVFMFLVPGMPAFTMMKMAILPFYGHKDSTTPMKINLIFLALNLVLCLACIGLLRQAAPAFATSVTSMMSLAVLLLIARRRGYVGPLRPMLADFCVVLALSLVAGAAALGVRSCLDCRTWILVTAMFGVYVGVYLLGCHLLKVEAMRPFTAHLARLWRSRT